MYAENINSRRMYDARAPATESAIAAAVTTMSLEAACSKEQPTCGLEDMPEAVLSKIAEYLGRDFSCWEGPPGASLGDVAQETYLEEGYITRVDDSGPWIAQPRRKAFGGILEGPIAWLGLSCVWTGRSGWTGRGAQFDIQLVRPSERGHEGGARVVAECRHVFEDAPLRLPRIIATLITPSSKRVAMSPAPFVPLSANVLRSTEAEQSIVSLAKAGDEFRVVRSVEVGGDLTVRCFRLVYGSSVRKDAAVHMKDGENFLASPPPSWDVFACLVDSEEESSFYTLLDLGEDVESHITPEY